MDSLTALHKLMKSHLTKHVQDFYNVLIQYNNLKSLLCSNIGTVLGDTFINITRRSLSKRPFCLLKQKIKR